MEDYDIDHLVYSTGREHSPAYQQKIRLQISWAWPHPSEQDPVSLTVSLSHQEASISLLSFSIREQTEWKAHHRKLIKLTTWTTQPCLTQWNYEPCHVGPSKLDRSWWRVLRKRGPLEKGMANHFTILVLRIPWTVWKDKKIWHWKMNCPGR